MTELSKTELPNNKLSNDENSHVCCDRGGARPGCGRKPGIKTQPIRLPKWLIASLEQQGDAKQMIIEACMKQYSLECRTDKDC